MLAVLWIAICATAAGIYAEQRYTGHSPLLGVVVPTAATICGISLGFATVALILLSRVVRIQRNEARKALTELQGRCAAEEETKRTVQLVDAELSAISNEAHWLQTILNRNDPVEVAAVKPMVPEWKAHCADFLHVALGSPPLPEGNADAVHQRICELADNLSPEKIRIDGEVLERAIETRHANPVAKAMKSSADAQENLEKRWAAKLAKDANQKKS